MGRGEDAEALKPDQVQRRPGRSYFEPGTADLTENEVVDIEESSLSDEQEVFEGRKRARAGREGGSSRPSRNSRGRRASEAERNELLRDLIDRSTSGEEKMKARLIEAAGNMDYEMRTDELNIFSEDEGILGIPVGNEELIIEKKDLRKKDGSPFAFNDFIKGETAYVGSIAISYAGVNKEEAFSLGKDNESRLLNDNSYENIKFFLDKMRKDLKDDKK